MINESNDQELVKSEQTSHNSQSYSKNKMSMGKPTICIGENKGADQLRSNCEADQRLCFSYTASTVTLLSKSKILSF